MSILQREASRASSSPPSPALPPFFHPLYQASLGVVSQLVKFSPRSVEIGIVGILKILVNRYYLSIQGSCILVGINAEAVNAVFESLF
jgi:hypothetical protein